MERHIDHLFVYRGPNDPDGDRAEILCRVMSLAVISYNDLVGDMIKGNLSPETYPSWTDFDGYRCFSVASVGPAGAARYHLPPGTTALVVCYDEAVVAQVVDLDMARELIADASGRRVRLVLDEDGDTRVWLPAAVGVPADGA
jgi:hypothetical protein